MNQNFSGNIKLLRKRRRKTQDDVSQALNMKRSTLSGYENNVGQPGVESLVAISEYYGVTIDTLVKVDLSALSESQLSQLERGYDVYIKGSNLRVLTTTVDGDNNENIELVPEKAKAGYQRGFADPGFISELPVFQLPFLSREKKYRTFQINGDSMLPIPDGSWVTGEFIQDWFNVKDGEACIILTLNEGIVFKIVENRLEKSGMLIAHSLNPIYKPYEISVKEIKELWKFSHYISQEMPDPEINNETVLQKLKKLQNEVADIRKKM